MRLAFYYRMVRSLLCLVILISPTTLIALAQEDATTQLYAQCSAAFRAHDFVTASTVCLQSAEANFTEANELITNKRFYYLDLVFGADSQETAGEAYYYGHIDEARSRELVEAAIATLRQVLNEASDPQTLHQASATLDEATAFEGRILNAGGN